MQINPSVHRSYFVDFCFTRKVLQYLSTKLDVPITWKETTYLQNIDSWFWTKKELTYLPPLMAWQIWLTRNKCIFDDKKLDIIYIVHTILE